MKRKYFIYAASCVLCLLASCSNDIDLQESQQDRNENTVSLKNDGASADVDEDYSYMEEAEEIGFIFKDMLEYSLEYIAYDESFYDVFISEETGELKEEINEEEWLPYVQDAVSDWAEDLGYELDFGAEMGMQAIENMARSGEYSQEQMDIVYSVLQMVEDGTLDGNPAECLATIEDYIWSLSIDEQYEFWAMKNMMNAIVEVIDIDSPIIGQMRFRFDTLVCNIAAGSISYLYGVVAACLVSGGVGAIVGIVSGAILSTACC